MLMLLKLKLPTKDYKSFGDEFFCQTTAAAGGASAKMNKYRCGCPSVPGCVCDQVWPQLKLLKGNQKHQKIANTKYKVFCLRKTSTRMLDSASTSANLKKEWSPAPEIPVFKLEEFTPSKAQPSFRWRREGLVGRPNLSEENASIVAWFTFLKPRAQPQAVWKKVNSEELLQQNCLSIQQRLQKIVPIHPPGFVE